MIRAVIERCAGIDVGKTFIVVCVMTDPRRQNPAFKSDVSEHSTRNWNGCACGSWPRLVHTPLWRARDRTGSRSSTSLKRASRSFSTSARDVKIRKGHKTDWKDSRWLAHLLRHGMIRPSFIPERGIRELRGLTRRRKQLTHDATGVKNRVSKVLEEGNIKLGSVLTDIFGVTGRAILEALLEGKMSPSDMAQFAKRSAKRKIPEITASMEKHRLTDEQRFLIRQSLRQLEFLASCIDELEQEDSTSYFSRSPGIQGGIQSLADHPRHPRRRGCSDHR